MIVLELLTVVLVAGGVAFYIAGSIGVLRFPDARSRLHAVAKADTLGLGLVVVGLMLVSASVAVALKLLLIWMITLCGSAAASYLIGGAANRDG